MEENTTNLPEEQQPETEKMSAEDSARLIEEIENATASETDPRDAELKQLKQQLEEQKDKYLRLFADFDNFKKRNAKERLELIQTAGKDVIKDLLPVLDDFERAVKAAATAPDVAAVREGMELIAHKLQKALEAKGLKPIISKGTEFNVEHHEAITEIPAPTPDLAGKVVDEVEKGYYLNDKIIRFAKVVVGK
ncbi:MAG: nucleotide exchange factor GrpE [Chitinophagales bacterium]